MLQIKITYECDPHDIKKTNAIHRDDNADVLTDLRMDKLIGNMEDLNKMQTLGSLTHDEMQAVADATDGIDVDQQEQNFIRF